MIEMRKMLAVQYCALILLSALVFSCKKDMEKPQWDTNILAPFAYTEMGIENIVKDGSAQTNSDQSVDLFVRDTLYTLQMDSLVSIATPNFDIYRTLDSIRFDTAPIVTKITLGQMARQMEQNPSTAFLGAFILASQGQTITVPNINNITGGPIPINVSDILEQAQIKTGLLQITVDNGLPLDITHAEFNIVNHSPPNAEIAHPIMDNIAKGTSQTQTQDLAGEYVEGRLDANILDMDFAGGTVKIDTNNAVTITLTVVNVTVSSATAVFPAQNVINDHSVNYLLDMGTTRLKEMKVASGYVKIEVSSTIPDNIYFTYSIPGAVKDGVPFVANTTVPPSGGVTVFTYDMTGYTMSLRGAPGNDEYNGIYNELVGRIEYTGKKVALSLSDSIHVKISLDNAKPSYILGYLGDTTFGISGSVPLTVFNKITGGTLQFENADVAVVVDNTFGINGSAVINNITAHNGSSSASASSAPTAITAATDGPPPVVASSRVQVSNATAVVNVLPKTVDYNATLNVNPGGFTGDYTQFAYAAYPVKAYMEFKMPLSLIANQLQLTDTIQLSASPQLNTALKKGKLNLIVDNGFPFDAHVTTYFLDGYGTVMDSLVTNQMIDAAPKGADGKVTASKRSVVTYDLSSSTISNMQAASSVIFKATFNTDAGSYSKVYSDYRIKFKLAGDVQYTVNSQ